MPIPRNVQIVKSLQVLGETEATGNFGQDLPDVNKPIRNKDMVRLQALTAGRPREQVWGTGWIKVLVGGLDKNGQQATETGAVQLRGMRYLTAMGVEGFAIQEVVLVDSNGDRVIQPLKEAKRFTPSPRASIHENVLIFDERDNVVDIKNAVSEALNANQNLRLAPAPVDKADKTAAMKEQARSVNLADAGVATTYRTVQGTNAPALGPLALAGVTLAK